MQGNLASERCAVKPETERVPAYVVEYALRLGGVLWGYVVAPSGKAPALATFKGTRHGRQVAVEVEPMRRLCATCWALHRVERPHGHAGLCRADDEAGATDAVS